MENIEKLSFEDALSELESIIERLERGDVPLEESIALYERGAALKKHCDTKLQGAKEKIEKIVLAPDGQVTAEKTSYD